MSWFIMYPKIVSKEACVKHLQKKRLESSSFWRLLKAKDKKKSYFGCSIFAFISMLMRLC
jgi:hypothetical protein